MKLKLSPIFQDFKKDVEKNFKEIQDKISGIKKIDDKTVKTWFDIEFNQNHPCERVVCSAAISLSYWPVLKGH